MTTETTDQSNAVTTYKIRIETTVSGGLLNNNISFDPTEPHHDLVFSLIDWVRTSLDLGVVSSNDGDLSVSEHASLGYYETVLSAVFEGDVYQVDLITTRNTEPIILITQMRVLETYFESVKLRNLIATTVWQTIDQYNIALRNKVATEQMLDRLVVPGKGAGGARS